LGVVADSVADGWLNALCRNTAYSNAAVWVKLHTGDPGSAGTSNAAANTTRQQATFGAAASGRAITNTAVIEWTNVPNAETYSWVSLWSASTAGTFLGRDELSAPAVMGVGDTFRVPVGDCDLSVS
jgi:hypothetical protein